MTGSLARLAWQVEAGYARDRLEKMNSKKLAELTQYIENADLALQQAREVLVELGGDHASEKLVKHKAKKLVSVDNENSEGQIIEGVFNGQNMIGPDGKEYSVPANYASKSKLVEGDVLKLTIQQDGSFLYKQIKPVQRERVKGELVMDEVTGQYVIMAENNKKYNVLTASVTYFKGKPNDQVIVLIPKGKVCQWAVIENISDTDLKQKKDLNVQDEIDEQINNLLPEDTKEEKIKDNKKDPVFLKIKSEEDLEDL
ncbi:hypothetical protein ACFL1Y_01515 [Patescibacteria group bacterium]